MGVLHQQPLQEAKWDVPSRRPIFQAYIREDPSKIIWPCIIYIYIHVYIYIYVHTCV